MEDTLEKIMDQRVLVEKICQLQRKLDMTERIISDCIIILCAQDEKHKTVEYDEEDVGIAKHLIDACYGIVKDMKCK